MVAGGGLEALGGRLLRLLALLEPPLDEAHREDEEGEEGDDDEAGGGDHLVGGCAVKAFAAELKANPQFIISGRDAEAARASLVSRPLNATLLSFYGLRAAYIGKSRLAVALMASADAVSRRDAFSQLWMIEQKSGANDVGGAISHYNALLSVHPETQATLLPVLVSALAYPEVRSAMRPYLKAETRWSFPFGFSVTAR